MRVWVVIAASLLAVAGMAGAAPAAGGAASAYYLVRPDPRLCPSPICGGAWVRRVNHPTTRCVDGSDARECYVASVIGSPQGGTFTLARGRLVPAVIEGFPELGALRVSATWEHAGISAWRGPVYRVRDNGVRCVTSPCFSFSAAKLETTKRTTLSDVDLTRVGGQPAFLGKAKRALAGGGLIVAGTVRVVPDAGPAGDGRVLVATQFWLSG